MINELRKDRGLRRGNCFYIDRCISLLLTDSGHDMFYMRRNTFGACATPPYSHFHPDSCAALCRAARLSVHALLFSLPQIPGSPTGHCRSAPDCPDGRGRRCSWSGAGGRESHPGITGSRHASPPRPRCAESDVEAGSERSGAENPAARSAGTTRPGAPSGGRRGPGGNGIRPRGCSG